MSTTKEKKYSRTYYKTHRDYRERKIKQRSEYYHEHQKEQNAYERKRYRTNPSYRRYKIDYARAYQKKRRNK